MDFPIKRTPEQGHEVNCQAHALITAIENARDMEGVTPFDFRIDAQANFMHEADALLASGSVECLCD